MSLFRCPACGLPLTETEARLPNCAACGTAFACQTDSPEQPIVAPAAARRRRPPLVAWLAGGGIVAVLAVAAFLVWTWMSTERADPNNQLSSTGLLVAKKEPVPQSLPAQPASTSQVELRPPGGEK